MKSNSAAIRQDYSTVTLSDEEFAYSCKLIRDLTGISMSAAKRQLITRRIAGRLRALDAGSVADYFKILESGDEVETELFTNAVTTNLTSFFREKHHFEFLENTLLPSIIAKKGKSSRRIRIWSAGCSTGEESYSIAMTVAEFSSQLSSWDVKILCTDLDTEVLAKAKAGVYDEKRIEKVPAKQKGKWLSRKGDDYEVSPKLKSMMTFKQLNLMEGWPMRGPFDLIFCRNVVIYFDKPTQRILMDRYADLVEDGGHLILGHSESLFNVSDRFNLIGQTIYRKKY